jgi:tetratricopeptide (TPR) repeat protein
VYVAGDQGSKLSEPVPSFEDWAGVSTAGSSHLRGTHEEGVVECEPGFDFAEFRSSVHNMISSGQYDQAEQLCARSIEAVKGEFGDQSSEYAYALFLYGQELSSSGRFDDAKKMLTEALSIEAVSTRSRSLDAVGRITYVLAIIEGKLGNTRKRKSLLEEVVDIFQQSGDRKGVAGVKGALASTMQALGDMEGSKKMHEEVLAIQIELYGEGDIRVAHAKIALAEATGKLEGFAGQGKPLEQAIRLLTHHYSTREHIDVACALSSLAEVRRASGDIASMKELLEEVVVTWQAHYGTREHEEVATALESLATAHGILGDLPGMIERLEEVLIIREKLFGRKHENTALTLYNLALARMELHDDEGARTLLEEAVAIYEFRFGTRRHPDIARALRALAECTLNLEDVHGARRLLEEALATQKELFGERSKEVATTLRTLSSTEPDLKQRKKMLEEVLEMLDQHYGTEDHVMKSSAMSSLASVLGELGDYQGEADKLQAVVRMREQAYGTRRHTEVTDALFNLANAMSALRRHQDCKDILEEVLSLQEHVYGSRLNAKTSRTMVNLANAISALGDNQSARNMLEEALLIQEQIYGTRDHPEVVLTLWNLIRKLSRLGDNERMVETARECMMIQARLGDRRNAHVPL